jgi:hypothetical protein
LESRAERTYDRDFESIKNPRNSEPDDDEEMKTAPRQPIEPKRNIGERWRKPFGRLKSMVPTAAQRGPAGEVTLLGSIGFDGITDRSTRSDARPYHLGRAE